MNPIKQRTPAGDGQGHTNIKRVKEWQDNIGKPSEPQALSCRQCAFHREIPDKRGHIRDHCQFTGEKSPQHGMDGCHFIRGKWDPERINFLTAGKSRNNLEFPNNERPVTSLDHSQDGQKSGSFYLSHFPCRDRYVNKLAVQRPEPVRAGGLSLTGERCAAFLF